MTTERTQERKHLHDLFTIDFIERHIGESRKDLIENGKIGAHIERQIVDGRSTRIDGQHARVERHVVDDVDDRERKMCDEKYDARRENGNGEQSLASGPIRIGGMVVVVVGGTRGGESLPRYFLNHAEVENKNEHKRNVGANQDREDIGCNENRIDSRTGSIRGRNVEKEI